MKTRIILLFSLFILSSSLFIACKKSNSSQDNAHLKLYLTDAPGDYEAVIIDVKDVQINVTGDGDEGWHQDYRADRKGRAASHRGGMGAY